MSVANKYYQRVIACGPPLPALAQPRLSCHALRMGDGLRAAEQMKYIL